MVLGVNNNGKFAAVGTYVAIFIANLLYLLPKGIFPTAVEIYDGVARSAFTTVVIWLANKGIEWKTKT